MVVFNLVRYSSEQVPEKNGITLQGCIRHSWLIISEF